MEKILKNSKLVLLMTMQQRHYEQIAKVRPHSVTCTYIGDSVTACVSAATRVSIDW